MERLNKLTKKSRSLIGRSLVLGLAVMFASVLVMSQKASAVTNANFVTEAEKMVINNPNGAVVADPTASGGSAVAFTDHSALFGLTAPTAINSLTIRLKTLACSSLTPVVDVSLDSGQLLNPTKVTATSWTTTTVTSSKLFKAGTHKVRIGIDFVKPAKAPSPTCAPIIYVDNIVTNAVSGDPFLTLIGQPQQVEHNHSSILMWMGDQIKNCVASGHWAGNKATTGIEETAKLKQQTSFTLTCTKLSDNKSLSVTTNVGVIDQ